jgi:hypothetical protein
VKLWGCPEWGWGCGIWIDLLLDVFVMPFPPAAPAA